MARTSTAAAARKIIVRAAQITLFGLDGAAIVGAGIVVAGDDMPEIVMWSGDPFLRDDSIAPGAYRQIRPYRLDAGA